MRTSSSGFSTWRTSGSLRRVFEGKEPLASLDIILSSSDTSVEDVESICRQYRLHCEVVKWIGWRELLLFKLFRATALLFRATAPGRERRVSISGSPAETEFRIEGKIRA